MCSTTNGGLTPAKKPTNGAAPTRFAVCLCCRLPMDRPRKLWLVVVGRGYRPSLKAICIRCHHWFWERAIGQATVGQVRIVICTLETFESRCRDERTLQRALPLKLDASKGDLS